METARKIWQSRVGVLKMCSIFTRKHAVALVTVTTLKQLEMIALRGKNAATETTYYQLRRTPSYAKNNALALNIESPPFLYSMHCFRESWASKKGYGSFQSPLFVWTSN
jgi:hypothetical protein